jgi:hypothetical protein
MSITGTCDCGAVTVEIPARPTTLTSCNCTICHRLGTLWAYYPPAEVKVTGPTTSYQRGDKTLDLHHCPTCGCTTHWSPLPHRAPADRMGINARLLPPDEITGVRVRRLDGRSDDWKYLDE